MIQQQFLLKIGLSAGALSQILLLSSSSSTRVLAQDTDTCTQNTDCLGCLDTFNCVWMKDGTCVEGCGSFPNVDCYFPRIFAGLDNLEKICETATDRVEAQETCFAHTGTDATTCLASTGCDWVTGNIESSRKGSWCVLDLVREIAAPTCTGATTCKDCLSDDDCVWMKGDTCRGSCDNFPNVDCYYTPTFGATFSPESTNSICEVATDLMTEQELCFANTDQTSCLATQANTTCAWISSDRADDVPHCSYNLDEVGEGGNGGSSGRSTGFGASFKALSLVATSSLLLLSIVIF